MESPVIDSVPPSSSLGTKGRKEDMFAAASPPIKMIPIECAMAVCYLDWMTSRLKFQIGFFHTNQWPPASRLPT